MDLLKEFKELRRVGTPWAAVSTPDYRETIRAMSQVRYNKEATPACIVWDFATGHQGFNAEGVEICTEIEQLREPDLTMQAPAMMLKLALLLPDGAELFMVIPDNKILDDPSVIQTLANIRDEFKTNHRTLILLGRALTLPALVKDDIPLLEDPLPDVEGIKQIARDIFKECNLQPDEEAIGKAAHHCRGLVRFAVEDALARKIHPRTGAVDLAGLTEIQRTVIEATTNRALTFEGSKDTFKDIGGLHQIKRFSELLFNGSRPPAVVVRIEEIEKAMAGSGASGAGDSSGTTQDQLGVLLREMEDNNYSGILATGVAGSGKSLLSKTMAATFGAIALHFDISACKNFLVGESEKAIRQVMQIIKTLAGEGGAFFVATSNRLDVIPPELKRRFRYGTWFFDALTAEEKNQVWEINLKKYGLPPDSPRPKDDDLTGADVRNICELASALRCSLEEASKFIVPVLKSDPDAIERMRNAANGKFLSASTPGVYRKPTEAKSTARKISV